MTFVELLAQPTPDFAALAAHLDGLTPTERLAQTLALDGRAQARLFELAQGKRRVRITDLVAPSLPPLSPVAHEGRNSLPAFKHFAKVFVRPDTGDAKELWGYNRTSAVVSTLVGPGYYVAYDQGADEVLVDYLRQPPKGAAGWPPILRNDQRLSRFVYNRTQDVLRGVSQHVTIGRATRDGKTLDNWFVLCREA
jgi:hypothetical protein